MTLCERVIFSIKLSSLVKNRRKWLEWESWKATGKTISRPPNCISSDTNCEVEESYLSLHSARCAKDLLLINLVISSVDKVKIYAIGSYNKLGMGKGKLYRHCVLI